MHLLEDQRITRPDALALELDAVISGAGDSLVTLGRDVGKHSLALEPILVLGATRSFKGLRFESARDYDYGGAAQMLEG